MLPACRMQGEEFSIPPFDLTIAHDLYTRLLKPVEDGWKPAKSLVVVTNGSLGLLPLSLLPTAPAKVDQEKEPMFSSYRDVPWLARTHAVTVIPSANALRTLRRAPPTVAKRELMIGFGDPVFSKEQADEKPQQIGDEGGLLVGLEQHHRARIARQPTVRWPRTRRKFGLHGVLLTPGRSGLSDDAPFGSIPQQLVDRGFRPRLLVDALDDHGAIEARAQGAVLGRFAGQ